MSALAIVGSRATQALRQSVHPALRRLSVEETDTTIVISGCVDTYYQKQLAQEAVLSLGGQHTIINRVQVVNGQ